MATKDEMQNETAVDMKTQGLRAGVYIFMMLIILTLGEFLIASIASAWTIFLWAVAVWKAFLVVKNYMHIGSLFAADEEAH